MIKRIELINFMSHRHTVIEPSGGLTVLIGPNNCGKSAFVTALQILCHNSNSGFVLRHGEKKCEVIVETEDGHVIHWSRKKNGAGVYVVDGEKFDRLRGKVPPQVHDILKMPKVTCDNEEFDVHFGEQSEPVFLLRNRGKASAQFFASSSDATHLVAMQNLHKSKVAVAKRDLKQLTDEQSLTQKQLETLAPVDGMEKQLGEAEADFRRLEKSAAKIESLEMTIANLVSATERKDRANRQAKTLKPLAKPPQLTDDRPLRSLASSIKDFQQRLDSNATMAKAMAPIASPPVFEDENLFGRLLLQMKTNRRRQEQLVQAADAFNKIESPPAMRPELALVDMVSRLQDRDVAQKFAAKASKLFETMPDPPKMTQTQPLSDTIGQLVNRRKIDFQAASSLAVFDKLIQPPARLDESGLGEHLENIKSAKKNLAQRQQQVENVEGQIDDMTDEFEAWVAANPVCPACGGETDAAHVMKKHLATDLGQTGAGDG